MIEISNHHSEISDSEFEMAFQKCQVPPAAFSHEAHLRLAWIHITKYGLTTAEVNIQAQLERFVNHVGANDKYNKTLTVSSIRMIGHFIQQSKTENFIDFILEFPQLKNEFRALIASHYSFDVFNSRIAKEEFIAPDLSPF